MVILINMEALILLNGIQMLIIMVAIFVIQMLYLVVVQKKELQTINIPIVVIHLLEQLGRMEDVYQKR